jgi:hypothetical protein
MRTNQQTLEPGIKNGDRAEQDAPGTDGAGTGSPSEDSEGAGSPLDKTKDDSDLFTDARGGYWAGATTIFCVAVVAVGNMLLLSAALGSSKAGDGHWGWGAFLVWALSFGIPIGLIVGLLWMLLPWSRAMPRSRWTGACAGGISLLATALVVGLFYGTAALSSTGRILAWQPVVGLTLSVVAVASFGGYYLASRRSRVGFAASFILTFLVLLCFMLTLDGLAQIVDGRPAAEAQGAARAVRDLLNDFRGAVTLIVSFYFGSDAAISIAKLWKTKSADLESLGRLDRDMAMPKPAPTGNNTQLQGTS